MNTIQLELRKGITRFLWFVTVSAACSLFATSFAQAPAQPKSLLPEKVDDDPFSQSQPAAGQSTPKRNPPGATTPSTKPHQGAVDPTQPPQDVRRILEGEPRQTRRNSLPSIEVAAKILQSNGTGKALLKINGRFMLVAKDSRFSISGGGSEQILLTVKQISSEGVELMSSLDNQVMLLP